MPKIQGQLEKVRTASWLPSSECHSVPATVGVAIFDLFVMSLAICFASMNLETSCRSLRIAPHRVLCIDHIIVRPCENPPWRRGRTDLWSGASAFWSSLHDLFIPPVPFSFNTPSCRCSSIPACTARSPSRQRTGTCAIRSNIVRAIHGHPPCSALPPLALLPHPQLTTGTTRAHEHGPRNMHGPLLPVRGWQRANVRFIFTFHYVRSAFPNPLSASRDGRSAKTRRFCVSFGSDGRRGILRCAPAVPLDLAFGPVVFTVARTKIFLNGLAASFPSEQCGPPTLENALLLFHH
ncbi:hypothetical protein BJ912DRAFT_89782 [Pholiota molesta]|nr:hypothetical protein BJ912DRAFT_89782 [Pholiota molesta]